MNLLFDELDLKAHTNSITLKSAKKFIRLGYVQDFNQKGDRLFGHFVNDAEKEKLTVSVVKTREGIKGYCNCHEKISLCQHAVALCLFYLESVAAKKSRLGPLPNTENIGASLKEELKITSQLKAIVKFDHVKHDYSLYFFEPKSERLLDEAFFFLHPPNEIFHVFNRKLETKLHHCFADYGADFFLPNNFYELETEGRIIHDLIEQNLVSTPDNAPYSRQQHPLKFQLEFQLHHHDIYLRTTWVQDVTNEEVPLQSGSLVWGSPPLFVTNSQVYEIKNELFFKFAKSFITRPTLHLDIHKFEQFMHKKGKALEAKGALIKMNPKLKKMRLKKMPPQIYYQVFKRKDELIVRPIFKYQDQWVGWKTSGVFVLDETECIFYERDTVAEKKLLVNIDQMKHQKIRGVMVFKHNRIWECIDFLKKSDSFYKQATKEWVNQLKVSRNKITPKIKFQPSKLLKKIPCNLSFEVKGKELPESLAHHIFHGEMFIQVKNDVHPVDCPDPIPFMFKLQGQWKDNQFHTFLDFGEKLSLLNEVPEYCEMDSVSETQARQLLAPKHSLALTERFDNILHPYQKEGVSWLYELFRSKIGGILADDMGLGKTIQVLALIDYLKMKKEINLPILIIVPKTLLFNWELEIQKFVPETHVIRYEGRNRKKLLVELKPESILLVSYHTMRIDIAELRKHSFDYAILDEGQMIKNVKSQLAQATFKLSSKNHLILTGTPVENRPADLWSLFYFLNPGYLPKWDEFIEMFDLPIRDGDPRTLAHLKVKIAPFLLRRMKQVVAKQLPPKTEQVLFCEMGKEQRELYKKIAHDSWLDLQKKIKADGIEKSRFHIFTLLTKLRQCACHPGLLGPDLVSKESQKFEMVKAYITEILSEDHKIVIFSQFVEMLNIMGSWLKEEKIGFEMLTGKTRKRKEAVERFNNDPRKKIFLASLKAGGVGLNLTAADYVFLFDPWWNPAVENQARDRIYRLGQNKSVFVYKIITSDTVEEKIFQIQKKKEALMEDIFVKSDQLPVFLSQDEIKTLFH